MCNGLGLDILTKWMSMDEEKRKELDSVCMHNYLPRGTGGSEGMRTGSSSALWETQFMKRKRESNLD